MARGEWKKSVDFYYVLGLDKECSVSDLKNAYKKLALRWHPDRCSASGGNSKFVEEAKKKFQAIQEAYSVLSDPNKRFLYDIGIHESDDDDDENGMCDFLEEMTVLMSQTKPNENGQESFEELQELFHEMFQRDIDTYVSTDQSSSSSSSSANSTNNNTSKRSCLNARSGKTELDFVDADQFIGIGNFCLGIEDIEDQKRRGGKGGSGKQRIDRKQNVHYSQV